MTNADGNSFTVGFLEVDMRAEPRTGYTTPCINNALAMLFINFKTARGINLQKLAVDSETAKCDVK